MSKTKRKFEYDAVLSFAGEDRKVVKKFYDVLAREGLRIFYDNAEQTKLWGKDLYQHLQEIYRDKARFCVVFVSKHYLKKRWTKHELKQAQERAFVENREYILPIRIDDTDLPGMNSTTGYIDLKSSGVPAVAALLLNKLGRGSLGDDAVDRLGWNGKYVSYNGTRMVSYWPKHIRAAQKQKTMRLVVERIKYGEESWRPASKDSCRDCGVVKGQFHVSSCDVEECPICHFQLLSCDCNFS